MLENPYEYEPAPIKHRPLWLDVLLSLACFFTAALIIASFAGCATPEKVCYIRPMGQTDDGFVVIAQSCMSAEAFQKAQE